EIAHSIRGRQGWGGQGRRTKPIVARVAFRKPQPKGEAERDDGAEEVIKRSPLANRRGGGSEDGDKGHGRRHPPTAPSKIMKPAYRVAQADDHNRQHDRNSD